MQVIFLCAFLFSTVCDCFRFQASRSIALPTKIACSSSIDVTPLQSNSFNIDMKVHRTVSSSHEIKDIVPYDSVYKEFDDKRTEMMDSPAVKVLGILFNPMALIFALYFVLVGYTQVGSFITNVLCTLRLKKRSMPAGDSLGEVLNAPFQVFECDVCEMQMRPAKGRAAKIFGRERFRCARCGAKASSYYNIEDMSDARAVARKKRLEEAEANDNVDEDEGERE